MRSFGASAPAAVLYREFDITPQSVAAAARRSVTRNKEGKAA
jgi:transketolase